MRDIDTSRTPLSCEMSTPRFLLLLKNIACWSSPCLPFHDVTMISFTHFIDEDEDVVQIIPKPATPVNHQPLYLCLRISKKHWCIHHAQGANLHHGGEDLWHRDLKRREYWFAIPPSRFVWRNTMKCKSTEMNWTELNWIEIIMERFMEIT